MRLKPYRKYDPRRLQPGVWIGHKIASTRHAKMHSALILCAYRHPYISGKPGDYKGHYCGECRRIVEESEH